VGEGEDAAKHDFAADNADRTCQRAGLSIYLAGAHADVIAAAGSHIAHAGDHRLLAAFELVPDQIARESRTAGAVDPQDNCFDGVVFFRLLNRLDHGCRANRAAAENTAASFARFDAADCINDRNLWFLRS
jgi:hypothetical protein